MSVRFSGVTDRIAARVQSRHASRAEDGDAGMVTSEYAMGTAVAAGCAGILYKIVTSSEFLEVVKQFILRRFLRF